MCVCVCLTRPARLGFPLTEEVTELRELMEEALGLLFMVERLREEALALARVLGKPIRLTLWTGANRPYRGRHWKYLEAFERDIRGCQKSRTHLNHMRRTDS